MNEKGLYFIQHGVKQKATSSVNEEPANLSAGSSPKLQTGHFSLPGAARRGESSQSPSHFLRCLPQQQQLAGISASFPFGSDCTLHPPTAIKGPGAHQVPWGQTSLHPFNTQRHFPQLCRGEGGLIQRRATRAPAREGRGCALLPWTSRLQPGAAGCRGIRKPLSICPDSG